MAPKNILITGGCGFIGTHLAAALRVSGARVRVLDIVNPRSRIDGVEYVLGSVLNSENLLPLVSECDHVVHLAAKVSVPLCEKDPVGSYETNFLGTVRVADAIASANSQRSSSSRISLLFSSSAAVYGDRNHTDLVVEDQVSLLPTSLYAHQKISAEIALRLMVRQVPSLSFRFFNVFGPGQDPNSPYSGVISVFTDRLAEALPVSLYGDGNQSRDFISVHDIVSGLIRALGLPLEKKNGRAINLCTEVRTTIRELGETIARVSGKPLVWIEHAPRPGDIRHSCGDSSAAKEILNWSPQTTLSSGLSEIIRPNNNRDTI